MKQIKWALAVLLLASPGCGDSSSTPSVDGAGLDASDGVYLQPFFGNPIELQVNQEINIDVMLSKSPSTVKYVDIENPAPDQIILTPTQSVRYDVGDLTKQVKLYPAQKTNGRVQLVFTLRGTLSSHTFGVTVK
ncbi:MAG: hypothetical protein KC503_19390 [Myxococcales bacterium]|nr:hypothetical protein [Myxococcales bacterium]